MTRDEAISYWKFRSKHIHNWLKENENVEVIAEYVEAIDMAVEALQREDRFLKSMDTNEPLYTEVVRCKDCIHANECHKSVQYTRNELNTVTLGFLPIEWCSRGERKGGEADD